jgi:D-beta-D-heptose 7-phosphate kinase/D-beta-D-heptose 1-phosphate adenosyltransferase
MRDSNALSHGSVAALLERFQELRLLVIGDVMLDEYRSGDVSRTSPEAPVPVVKVQDEHHCLGGAANVANVARALGASVDLFGAVGSDVAGERFTNECERLGIESTNLVRTDARPTTRKLRVLAQHQQVLRLDWEEERPIADEVADEVLARLRRCERPDVVIVSDYAKGFLTPKVLEGLMQQAKQWGAPVLVDPKYADLSRYRGATVIKANLREFEASVGHRVLDDLEAELAQGSAALMDAADIDALVVTLGERGLAICSRNAEPELMPTSARDVYDVSGAGDAVITVLGLSLALGVDIRTAARLANEAAGIAVGKSGVAVVEPEELAARFIHGVRDKVISRDELESRVAWWRVQKQKVVFTNGCFDLLHVGHLHVLRQAAALGDVLLVAVNSDDSVRRLKGETRPLIDERDRTALLAALDCVDAVVVFDEDTPLELIRAVRPHVLVKGGDYEREQVVGHDVIEAWGGTVELVPLLPGHSTTNLVDRIRSETPSSRP